MNREAVVREAFALRFKYNVLEFAREIGNDAKSYRFFEVPKATFYRWKKAYAEEGKAGLVRKKPIAKSHPRQVPAEF